jgi:hypothetical protein
MFLIDIDGMAVVDCCYDIGGSLLFDIILFAKL